MRELRPRLKARRYYQVGETTLEIHRMAGGDNWFIVDACDPDVTLAGPMPFQEAKKVAIRMAMAPPRSP